jgi:hypothetical protein
VGDRAAYIEDEDLGAGLASAFPIFSLVSAGAGAGAVAFEREAMSRRGWWDGDTDRGL